MEVASIAQVALHLDPLLRIPGAEEAQREGSFRFSEGKLLQVSDMRKAGDILQLVECNLQTPQRAKVAQEIQVGARVAVNVELDVRPIGD